MNDVTQRIISLIQQSTIRLATLPWTLSGGNKRQILELDINPHHPSKKHLRITTECLVTFPVSVVSLWLHGDWVNVSMHICGLDLAAIGKAMHDRYRQRQKEYLCEKERLGVGHLSDEAFELWRTLDLLPEPETPQLTDTTRFCKYCEKRTPHTCHKAQGAAVLWFVCDVCHWST